MGRLLEVREGYRYEGLWRTTYSAGTPSRDRLLGFIWKTVTKLLIFPSLACASASRSCA